VALLEDLIDHIFVILDAVVDGHLKPTKHDGYQPRHGNRPVKTGKTTATFHDVYLPTSACPADHVKKLARFGCANAFHELFQNVQRGKPTDASAVQTKQSEPSIVVHREAKSTNTLTYP
jgi:hypothetical protein